MKKSIVILLFISLLLACSKNYTVVTRVLPHGNGYREFLITPDSALMTGDTSKNKVPVMIDSSWKVTWFSYNLFTKKKSNVATWPINHFNPNEYNTKEITLVVHRDFASANELDGSKYYNHTSWRQIHPETVIRD